MVISSMARKLIIDEFVTSARAKWGQTPSLVFYCLMHMKGRSRSFQRTSRKVFGTCSGHKYAHRKCNNRCTIFPFTAPSGSIATNRSTTACNHDSKEFTASSYYGIDASRDCERGTGSLSLDDDSARSHAQKVRRIILYQRQNCCRFIYERGLFTERRNCNHSC